LSAATSRITSQRPGSGKENKVHQESNTETLADDVVALRQRVATLEAQLRLLEDVEEDLVRTAAALRDSKEKFRLLVEEINDIIYTVDCNKVVTYISPVIEAVSGYEPSEICGRSFLHFVYEADIARVDAQFQENISGSLPLVRLQFRVLTKPGKIRWARTYSRTVLVDNCVVGLRGVMTDVTQQVQLAEEQERLILALRDALAQIETLNGLLPICSSCKKIRDSEGQWVAVEEYLSRHSRIRFTHDLCPECAKALYPGVFGKDQG
jgi:PAS domain S-box-containing protein